MKKLLFLAFLLPFWSSAQCSHSICLYDTFGDGWNGGSVTVYVNGSPVLTNITLASGGGPACFNFQANSGDAIQVTYVGGSWAYENNFTVTDGNGGTLVSGYFPSSSGTWNGTGACTVQGGSNCTHTICLYDTFGDGWNGGSVTVYVNGSPVLVSATLASGSGPTCFNFQAGAGDAIQVTYGAGSWAYENYFSVTDGNGSILVSNYYPNTSGTWNGSGACPVSGGSNCTHTICLTDTWGDGWNGGSVSVLVNGSPVLSGITVASGAGPDCFNFQASSGDAIQVTYSAGSWAGENYYSVTDGNGSTLVSNYFPNTSGTWNGTGGCTSSGGGGTCSQSICLSDTYGDGWNGGSASVLVNGSPVLTGITVPSGYGPSCYNFPASLGDVIQVTYSAGSWAYENYYSIMDGNGGVLVSNYYPNTSGTWNGNGNCSIIVLPVSLLDFNGDCEYLYWSTASEHNNQYFQIEKSYDGSTWEVVGTVDAIGNSTEISDYTFKHNSRDPLQYYRLRQVDFDGKFEIFDMISVKCRDSKVEGEIVGVYNTAGQLIGSEFPTVAGIYLIRYSNGFTKKISVL